ncbi:MULTISPECIES: sigma-E factor regulatory protein RseB [Vibrio]|uniref:Sigma-E factor regulatory protein RseB n=1 Tax=Vibrio casei TaxID=673372 RepID=A0A368LLL3_9VIBR|nr:MULTISPECIES: sigma-E factor regulatory protein RseB [Vibrio]RCS72676.1 sigma-E factor regulatory protein RseB [Vibrio casei]SJN23494.1 Sigma factor RpoE negative regulatory protein RseB precursor [Vibrio casei]HBV75664.1 sigma-E factor regulatory protein RseB [Vibrio sp.]
MKKILISTWLLLSLFSQVASAEDSLSAEALLHKMSDASKTLNYELSYILIKKNSIEPLLYRHAIENEQNLAHLVYLSGPVREVILRGNEVSYIEPGLDPFSIRSGQMVAPLIPMINSDIDKLSNLYDFVKIGRSREAGTACQVVRVVPKDGQRYSYIVWIDERTKLPLRADLVERNGEILEQYRTISYAVSDHIATILDGLNSAKLPDVLTLPKPQEAEADWTVAWVPDGFEPNSLNRYRMSVTGNVVESQLYSDGLFNFSVYVSDIKSSNSKIQVYRQGRRTLQTFVKDGHEVSVIGDIPPPTAKRIADSVTFTQTKGK